MVDLVERQAVIPPKMSPVCVELTRSSGIAAPESAAARSGSRGDEPSGSQRHHASAPAGHQVGGLKPNVWRWTSDRDDMILQYSVYIKYI